MTFTHAAAAHNDAPFFQQLAQAGWVPQALPHLAEHVWQARQQAQAALPDPVLPALATAEAHAAGAPLLPRENFPVDTALAERLFASLTDICAAQEDLRGTTQKLRAFLSEATFSPQDAFSAFVAENDAPFAAWAERAPEAPQLLYFLTANSLAPQLARIGAAVLPAHTVELWTHGHCPVCGSPVLMGELAKGGASRNPGNEINKGGQRIHACSFCSVTFRAKRLQCPYCLEENAEKQRFFTVPAVPDVQVHVCDNCQSYCKLADFRERYDRFFRPELDDLDTLPLDLAAQQAGYHRLAPTVWGL